MRPSWFLLIPVLSLCFACGCKKAVPPESYLYYGSMAGARVPNGVQFYLDDKVIGTVKGSLSFRLPHGTLLSTSFHRLTLRLATPCGLTPPVRLKVRSLTEQAERKKQEEEPNSGHHVTLEVEGNPTWPRSAMFWVDNGEEFKRKVAIGQVSIGAGYVTERNVGTTLYGLDCAAQHDLFVDGNKVGVLDQPTAQADVVPLYFVTADAKACYRFRSFQYAPAGTPGSAFEDNLTLSGATIYPLPNPPTYFLRTAPARSTNTGRSYELTLTKCKDGDTTPVSPSVP